MCEINRIKRLYKPVCVGSDLTVHVADGLIILGSPESTTITTNYEMIQNEMIRQRRFEIRPRSVTRRIVLLKPYMHPLRL